MLQFYKSGYTWDYSMAYLYPEALCLPQRIFFSSVFFVCVQHFNPPANFSAGDSVTAGRRTHLVTCSVFYCFYRERGERAGLGVGGEFPIRCDESLCGWSQRGEVVSWHQHPHGEKQSPSKPLGEIHLQLMQKKCSRLQMKTRQEHFSVSI